MPVAHASDKPMKEANGNRPPWSAVSSVGVARMPAAGSKFECHWQKADEYWLVYKGKAKIMTEGAVYYVKPGDVVATKAGDEHDILEIYEDLEMFYFIDQLPEGGKPGHRFNSEEKRKGHPVATGPVPADFPA